MKTILKYLSVIFLLSGLFLAACSGDDDSAGGSQYGYLQFSVCKELTKGVTEGNVLEYLSDARKIRVSMLYNGAVIEQTIGIETAPGPSAEYGIITGQVRLLSGTYRLLSYAIYGDYKGGDMAPVLQVVQIDGGQELIIRKDELTIHPLTVKAKSYGSFSADLVRLEPVTKASGITYSDYFSFSDIDSVRMVLGRKAGSVSYSQSIRLKASPADSGLPVFHTDTVSLQAGDYIISHFELFNRRRQFMYAQDVNIEFSVGHFEHSQAQVGVQMPETEGVLDGIALRQIWEAMDGQSWSFHDQEAYGSNWVFTLSDGSPRPVSAWVRQPGVVVNPEGRVISLNLGAFNPKGMVPDAIGQLTALERLYLGEHTDEVYYTLQGVGDVTYSLSPYQLSKRLDVRLHRMDIARERTRMRHLAELSSRESALAFNGKTMTDMGIGSLKYAQKVQTGSYDPANRITGISEEIGKLKNVTELYIANTLITKLPDNLAGMTSVTDLELYNNPFTELDGKLFRNMSNLTSVNIDRLFNLSETQLLDALDEMCENCQKIQLLYICNLKLSKLPSKLNHLVDLRLLDASFNRIDTIGSLLPIAPVQVMLSHNLLQTLPEDLFAIDDIEMFLCTDNRLKEFPALLGNLQGQYSFETVDLTGNRMHGFQPGFKGIRTEKLLMASNYMGHLPGSDEKGPFPTEFASTGSVINYLDVSYNNIDTIYNEAFKGITGLQALDMSKNELRSVPRTFSRENLPWLTGLDVSHNRFDGFPSNVLNVTSLQQLLIADQGYFSDAAQTRWVRSMTDWPEYLHQHPALMNVDMKGNDFRTVTNFPDNLITLNVKNNPHIRMVVPSSVMYRILHGLFVLYCDEDQDITSE